MVPQLKGKNSKDQPHPAAYNSQDYQINGRNSMGRGSNNGGQPGLQSAQQPPLLKVIMVGSGGVGKSALTLQFMYDEVSKLCLK